MLNNPLNIANTNNFISNGGNDQILNVTGSGLVNLEGTGANVLTFAGDISTFNGIFNLDTLANVRFLPNSGTLVGGPNVIFNLGAGSGFLNNRNGNLTTLLGSIFGGTSTTVQGASSTDNRPTTYIVGLNNANNEFDGKFTEVSGARKVNLVKSGTGTFTLVQSQPYTGFTTVSNGVLALAFGTNTTSADGSLDGTTNIEVTATGILDVSGRDDGTLQPRRQSDSRGLRHRPRRREHLRRRRARWRHTQHPWHLDRHQHRQPVRHGLDETQSRRHAEQ